MQTRTKGRENPGQLRWRHLKGGLESAQARGAGGRGTQTLSAGSPAPEGKWGKEILKIKETLTCL